MSSRQKLYNEYIEKVNKVEEKNGLRFDLWLLVLSFGGFVTSLFCIPIDSLTREAERYLILSWSLFGGVLFLMLFSYFVQRFSCIKGLENAKKYYLEEQEEYIYGHNGWKNLIWGLEGVSAVAALLGVVSLCLAALG